MCTCMSGTRAHTLSEVRSPRELQRLLRLPLIKRALRSLAAGLAVGEAAERSVRSRAVFLELMGQLVHLSEGSVLAASRRRSDATLLAELTLLHRFAEFACARQAADAELAAAADADEACERQPEPGGGAAVELPELAEASEASADGEASPTRSRPSVVSVAPAVSAAAAASAAWTSSAAWASGGGESTGACGAAWEDLHHLKMEFALCYLTDAKLARLSAAGSFHADVLRSRLFAEFWRQPQAARVDPLLQLRGSLLLEALRLYSRMLGDVEQEVDVVLLQNERLAPLLSRRQPAWPGPTGRERWAAEEAAGPSSCCCACVGALVSCALAFRHPRRIRSFRSTRSLKQLLDLELGGADAGASAAGSDAASDAVRVARSAATRSLGTGTA